jgi:hypothetical protein
MPADDGYEVMPNWVPKGLVGPDGKPMARSTAFNIKLKVLAALELLHATGWKKKGSLHSSSCRNWVKENDLETFKQMCDVTGCTNRELAKAMFRLGSLKTVVSALCVHVLFYQNVCSAALH